MTGELIPRCLPGIRAVICTVWCVEYVRDCFGKVDRKGRGPNLIGHHSQRASFPSRADDDARKGPSIESVEPCRANDPRVGTRRTGRPFSRQLGPQRCPPRSLKGSGVHRQSPRTREKAFLSCRRVVGRDVRRAGKSLAEVQVRLFRHRRPP